MSTFNDSTHATPEQMAEAHRRVLETLVAAAGDEQAFDLLLLAASEAGVALNHDEIAAELAFTEGAEAAAAYLAWTGSMWSRLRQRNQTSPPTAH